MGGDRAVGRGRREDGREDRAWEGDRAVGVGRREDGRGDRAVGRGHSTGREADREHFADQAGYLSGWEQVC